MSDLYAKRVLSKEQLEAIGCIAVESAFLDAFVEHTIWVLSGMNEAVGRLFTTTMTLGPRMDRLGELIEQRVGAEQYKKVFSVLIGDIKHENSRRNDAIHGLWRLTSVTDVGNDADGNPLSVLNSEAHRFKRDGGASTIKPDDCIRVATRLSELHDQLFDLLLSQGLLTRPE